jgi:hypothetical protein
MGRRILATWVSVLMLSVPAVAADTLAADTRADVSARTDTRDATPDPAPPAPADGAPLPGRPAPWTPPARPALLPALYAGSAALQAFDAYSTITALRRGATEANPMMQGVAGRPALFIGVKAAATAASIVAAERLWRQHHQIRAVVLMAVTNGFMAAVAAHNAQVLGSLQQR